MKKQNLNLSKDFSIEAIAYAVSGNADLGIRETGKTFTATKIAEQLMDCGIPFIAFDPVGRWKYLRIGKNGNDGYPVVVAGREGDLPLDEDSVEGIVRAAMQENVSLVLDLYTVLNKSHWRRIVEKAVLVLLLENEPYGVRHIFIEESAEFIPQRLGKSHFNVYSAIDSLARMGGNVSLGYTLINQRAEDINKSALEICERLLLHAQNGKNSLKGIEEWLKRTRTDPKLLEKIMTSLPELESGKCWVCSKREHEPTLVKIADKKTVHPDRRTPKGLIKGMAVDVDAWVEKIKLSLAEQEKKPHIDIKQKARGKQLQSNIAMTHSPNTDTAEIDNLRAEKNRLIIQLNEEKEKRRNVETKLSAVKTMLAPQWEQMQKIFAEVSMNGNITQSDAGDYEIWLQKFGGNKKKILELFIQRGRLTKQQAQILTGLNRESVRLYLGEMKRANLIKQEGDDFILQKP
jgi:hypothetical protein